MLALRALAGLSVYLGVVSASALPPSLEGRNTLHARATVNGSCISAPDDGTTSLVGLCVSKIARGEIASNAFWTDPLCVAAAGGSSMGAVLDAACCAGTCRQPLDTGNLDVATVYRSMVGSGCTSTPASNCALTWQPFVDFIYGTIQNTGTNIWPDSGDVILDRWQEIATWTGFCSGTSCVNGAIPYSNFNDWFHFSSAVTQTTPGTPQFVQIFPTLDENLDNTTPNVLWPCPFDDPTLCSWDWAPPPPGTFDTDSGLQPAVVRAASPAVNNAVAISATSSSSAQNGFPRFGRAPSQPPNLPPPVYANGQLLPLVLNGVPVVWNISTSVAALDTSFAALHLSPEKPHTNASTNAVKRAITPDACRGTIDIPSTLPTLTYYCDKLPQICANIRSHPDWNAATDTMDLTYDPWDGGSRRGGLCKPSVTSQMQAAGKCDPLQHSPYHWKVSCDEFPFSSSLEGGSGNAVIQAVSHYEQDLQSTLQSSITHLRTNQRDKRTKWSGASKCHRYTLKLGTTPTTGASPSAIGFLDAGSNFFSKAGETARELTNRHAVDDVPPDPFTMPTDYTGPNDNSLSIKGSKDIIDCTPCDSDGDAILENDDVLKPSPAAQDATAPTAPPDAAAASAAIEKRQASCTVRPTTAPLPTSSAEASAIAANAESVAKAAAAAAAAALASAANPAADMAAAAAAAVAAASSLGPAAAALAMAASDSALASAIASAQSVTSIAQNALDNIFNFGPSVPSWLSDILNDVSPASSSVSTAASSSMNVLNPATPIPPVSDPAHDPNVPSPPPDAPAAACFGAGSHGFLKIGDAFIVDGNGPVPAVLVDEGSDAYFGLTVNTNRVLGEVSGCDGVYQWIDSDLAPNFQVDCSTNEFGSFWSGVKQPCYMYNLPSDTPGIAVFALYCGTSASNIYSCLQQNGLFGGLQSAFLTWATSDN
ncbi:uncharacterized protein TRAVEDRAFT_74601 [Trametes versicolor FP-101664 SS1]|uniref:uncharacterized protein n=1 Tax=Trametes versicolor (strain FP-101664) TaxID=717944 RepID=UPI0004622F66|nr:uncharacterized protein TRAVEDRAFT_74601 [Trametes versicolor FP-101664 SS1]EIW53198.1 hypothetical protein TRAVEDRAFT_74601 [Trametes versicolor FP-101664 SS1]